MNKKHVVCSWIENAAGEVLLTKRKAGTHLEHRWEFPGGKVEAGESEAQALRRELKEEIGIDAEIAAELARVVHEYQDDSGNAWTVELALLRVRRFSGEIRALDVAAYRYVSDAWLQANMASMPPADALLLAQARKALAAGPALTFAIPFYSTPKYLQAAINSVRAQTRQDWALVVVDDKCPHKVAELVASYGDARLRYVGNDKNLGQSGNFNRCLEEVDTDLVSLLHADDELMPHYMETVLALMHAAPDASAAFCGAKIIDAYGAALVSVPDLYKQLIIPRGEPVRLCGEEGLAALLRGNFIMSPTLCYRKSRLQGQRFDPCWRTVPDLDFLSRLLLAGGTILGTRKVAFRYRRHADSATAHAQRSLAVFEEEVTLFRSLSERAAARGWMHAAARGKKARILLFRVAFAALSDLRRGDFAGTKKKAAFILAQLRRSA